VATETTTSPKLPIVIEPHQWDELSSILSSHLPGRTVWAFGSRATGLRVKRYSDLDLLIDGDSLSFREAALLDEALDESRLPFKVDVVQMSALAPEFRSRIQPELVLVQGRESTGIQSS
jgi:predicted nucleotidyltransferase